MVESTALEMRRAGNGTEGSNPSLSATICAGYGAGSPLFAEQEYVRPTGSNRPSERQCR